MEKFTNVHSAPLARPVRIAIRDSGIFRHLSANHLRGLPVGPIAVLCPVHWVPPSRLCHWYDIILQQDCDLVAQVDSFSLVPLAAVIRR